MQKVVVVADNLRSTHNIGSILRTCDGLGIDHVYICGTSPYPDAGQQDERLPHLKIKITKDIHKTALGAELTQSWSYHTNTQQLLTDLKNDMWHIAALEQSDTSIPLHTFTTKDHVALVVGPEVTGIDVTTLSHCKTILEIPMHGTKESFNVSVAAAIALYHIKTYL